MSDLLGPHIGHHVIATIAVKKLLIGWDRERHTPIWSNLAPDQIKEAILQYVEDHAEDETAS